MEPKEREWRFDRYCGGRIMAEGAIVRARTYEEAIKRAENLFREWPGDMFVLWVDIQDEEEA